MPVKRPATKLPKRSRQNKTPPQKDLGLDFRDEEEEDFSELIRQDGDAVDEEGDPYDCGYVDTESNFEDFTAKQEKLTPAELATRRLENNTDFYRRDPVPPKVPPPEERTYYSEVWGFDPATTQHPLKGVDYRYEEWFPLTNDLGLATAGMEVGARVDVVCPEKKEHQDNTEERIYNRIVFRRKGAEAAVHCTHTALYAIPATEIHNVINTQTTQSQQGVPAHLPAWGNFAALRSYVAAVAEVGIGTMLQAAWNGSPGASAITNANPDSDDFPQLTTDLPFGFNAALQGQVLRAIRAVAPVAAAALWRDWFMDLLDNAPPDWVISRREILLDLIKQAFTHTYNPFNRIGDLGLRDPALPEGVRAVVEELWQNAPQEWLMGHQSLLKNFFGDENSDAIAVLFEPSARAEGKLYRVTGDSLDLSNVLKYNTIAEVRSNDGEERPVLDEMLDMIARWKAGEKKAGEINLRQLLKQGSDFEFRGDLQSVRVLKLGGNGLASLRGFPVFSGVEQLDLSSNRLTDLEGIESFPVVKELNLSQNYLGNPEGISALTALERLDANQNRLQMLPDIRVLPELRVVNLAQNQITSVEGLTGCTRLEVIDLSNNQITGIVTLPNLNSLKTFKLSGNKIREISGFENSPQLEFLDLMNNQIETFFIGDQQKSVSNKVQNRIQTLYLGDNPLKSIKGIQNLMSLRILSIGNTKIMNLDDISNIPTLEQLELTGNEITDLTPLRHLPRLEELALSNCHLKSLAPLVGLSQLKVIDLWDAHIDVKEGQDQLSPIIRKKPF